MTDIFCGDCGAHGSVLRVTAKTVCACGSDNLGLVGLDLAPHTANRWNADDPEGGTAERQDTMAGGTWGKSRPWGSALADQDAERERVKAQRESEQHSSALSDTPLTDDDGSDNSERMRVQRSQRQGEADQERDRAVHTRNRPAPAAPAAPVGRTIGAKQGAGGTGWGKPMPSPTRGWSDYEGPTPATDRRDAPVNDNYTCPACHGAGYDLVDKTVCRECNGTGSINPPTSKPADYLHPEQQDPRQGPASGGARWQGKESAAFFPAVYPATYTTSTPNVSMTGNTFTTGTSSNSTIYLPTTTAGRPSVADPYGPEYQNLHGDPNYRARTVPTGPFDPDNQKSFYPRSPNVSPHVQQRQDHDYSHGSGAYQMDQATCPNGDCGHSPLELRKDKNEDAWAVCPHCGPLANVDKNPKIDPYSFPKDFTPDRGMKTSSLFGRNRKTGRLMAMLAVIHDNNDVHPAEALALARKTLAAYSE